MRNAYKRLLAAVLTLVILLALVPVIAKNNEHVATEPSSPERLAAEPSAVDVEEQEPSSQASSDAEKTAIAAELLNNEEASEEVLPPEIEENLQSSLSADSVSPEELYTETLPIEDIPQTSQSDTTPCDADFNDLIQSSQVADYKNLTFCIEDGKAVIRNYATDEVHDVAVENATALAVNGDWLFAAEGKTLNAYRLPEMTRNGVLTSDHEIEQFYIENGKAYFVSDGNIYVQPLEATQAQLLYDGGNAVSISRYSEDKLTFRTDDPMNDASEQTYIDETVEQEETSFLVNLSDGSVEGLNTYEKSLPDRSKKMNWNDGHTVRVGNVTLPLPEYPNGSACTTTGYACTSAHNACRRYYTYNGRTVDTYGWQCCGFARYVFWRCFGVVDYPEVANGNGYYHAVGYVPSGSVSVNYLKSIFGSKIKPGAHIRSNKGVDGWPHSLAFAGCDANYVWTYEGNYNGRCQVSMARRTWAEMAYFLSRTKYGIEYIDMPRNYPESDPLPQAAVDGVTGGLDQIRVWGWAFDKSNVGKALYVDVYVNGKGVRRMTANKSRPDLQTAFGVGNNHGFDETIAIDGFSGNVKVDVYAIGINARGDVDNRNTLITKYVNVSTEPKPESSLDVIRAGQNDVYVKGWAFDKSKASASLKIEVYVNDKKFTTITANKSRPDVGKAYSGVGDNHGFEETIALPGVSGNTKIELRAINIDENGNPRGKNNRTVGSARWLPLNPVSDLNESGIFRILSSSNRGFGLDVEGPSVENSANIHAWEVLRDNKNQMFRFVRTSDGYYTIYVMHSGKVVDVKGNSTAEDANVQQYESNNGDAQKFTIVHNSNDTYSFYNKTTGKCIDLANGKAANGTNIRMHTANGSAAESFYLEEVKPFGAFDTAKADQISGEVAISGWAADWSAPKTPLEIHVYVDGKRIIESKAGTKRDDIAKMNAALGAEHGFYEKFTLQPGTHKVDVYAINIDTTGKKVGTSSTHLGSKTVVIGERNLNENGVYRILSAANSKFGLDIASGSKNNGANVQLWETARDNKNQMFRLVRTSDGYYSFRALHSGMGLDITANNTAENTNLQQYNAYNGDSQKFIVGRNANGTYSFYSKTSGRCIDVDGGKTANGTNVRMHSANGSPAQCFYLEEIKPFGYFDAASANQLTGEVTIKGWAADWSSPKTSLQIHVYLDGKRVHMATADEKRDDVAKMNAELGDAHGYLEKFAAQPGTHKVDVYAINVDGSGKEITESSTHLGTKTVVIGEKNLNANGVYRIRSSVDKKYTIDVVKGSMDNGANVQVWSYSRDNLNQMFRLVSTTDGYYMIQAVHSGKVFDIPGNSTEENANVQQYEKNVSDAQKFTIGRNADGTYSFYSKTTGKCVDLAGAKAADGTNIRMHEANGSPAQKFYLEEVTPFGYFDTVAANQLTGEVTVTGWTADWSASKTPLQIHIYLDGKLIHKATAKVERPEVAKMNAKLGATHGYSEKFTAQPGTHKIEIYAINIDATGKEVGTGNTLIGTKTVVVGEKDLNVNGVYRIRSSVDKKFGLDVEGPSIENGANIHLWEALRDNKNQMFRLVSTSDGYYNIRIMHSGKAVDIKGNDTAENTNVQQHEVNTSDAQKFTIGRNANGTYSFYSKTTGKCIDVENGKAANGTNVRMHEANNSAAESFYLEEVTPFGGFDAADVNQITGETSVGGWVADWSSPKTALKVQVYVDGKLIQSGTADKNRDDIAKIAGLGGAHGFYEKFTVEPGTHKIEVYAVNIDAAGKEVGTGNTLIGTKTVMRASAERLDGTYNIALASEPNYMLDVNGASTASDANIQLYQKNNAACQMFAIRLTSDGYYTITAVHSGQAVDIASNGTADGTNIRQHPENGSDAQKFLITKNADGSYTFVGKTSGKCMDAQGGEGGNGVNIQLFTANGTSAQKFKLIPAAAAPQGGLDEVTPSHSTSEIIVGGWAADYNAPKSAIQVQVYLDGKLAQTLTADKNRSDIGKNSPALGSAHGYYVKLPVQSAMMHKVEVYAVNVDNSGKAVGSGNKLLGSKTVAVNKDRFDGLYNICLSSSQNYVLDVNSASKAENANIQLWTKNNSACQAFNITMGKDGFYTITAVHSNLAVDIDNDRTANGTNIRQHSVNNADAQKFLIVKNSDGSVTFFGKTSGKCMDAQGGKGGNGVNIQLYDSNGTAAQKFVLREPTILPSSGADNGSAGSYSGGMAGTGKVLAYGLDVSEHQGVGFNFQNVKNAGYSYVILRCGFVSRKDYRFEEYYNAARQAGLNIGVYFYSYATNADAASREADLCLSYIKGKKFEYPVYFDFEDPSAGSRNGNTAYSICRAFMDKVSAAGYLTGLYGYAGWMDAQNYGSAWVPIDSICGNKYELWMANYYDSNGAHFRDNYSRRFGMYQYTSTNKVNGVNVDTNMCFKDYPSIVKKYGFNGYTRTEHAPQGALDGANGGLDTVTVWGWAFDYSNCGKALYVDIYANGKPIKRVTANKFRQDIQNGFGAGSYHGFHEDLSLNGFSGNVKIDAYAIGIDSNGKLNNNNVLIGTKYANVTTEPKPESKLDEIKSNQDHIYVRGWAFDKSKADAALQIDVYVNDKKFTTITANKSRPDVGKAHSGVGNNHGFEETITLPGVSGNTKVELRAINIDEKGNPRGKNDQSIGGARYLPLDPVTDLNESGVFRILSAADRNYGLDVAGGSKNNGANIQIWSTSRDSRNQMFRFERTSDGYYSIRAMHSGMGVDITANNTAEDTNVQQYNAYNGDSQKFTVVRNANGTYSFYSKTSGRCIDVDCGKAANGTNVRMHSANGSAAESFYLEEVTPFGYLDTVTTDQLTGEISVKGWAADWSAPKTALQIHVYMDGQLVHKATAGVSRDDVAKQNADLGAAHGYLEKFAAQPGSHKIEVYAINIDAAGKEVGSGNTLLGTKTVVIGEQDLNEDGIFRILSSVDKKFGLDIEGPSKENGANIHLWEALRDNKNQMFRFERTADGYYNIRIMHSGKVVDVKDGSTAENANVQQFDANNSDAQKFAVVRNANGTYSFYNKTTGKCIDVDNGKAVNGTNVRMHEANNSAAESFYLEEVVPFGGFDAATADAITGDVSISGWAADWSAPKTAVQIQVYMDGQLIHKMAAGGNREDIAKANAELGDAHGFYATFQVQPGAHKLEVYAVNIDANGKEVGSSNVLIGTKTIDAPEPELNVNGIYRILSAVDRKYGLDVAANSKTSGANICLWEANRDGKNQMFRLVRTADGYYSFHAVHSGMGIDITANDTAENTNVRQFNAYDGDSQKFRIVRNANGTYTFYSKTSGKCIEIADGKAVNGTNVRMHSASGSPAQCFYLEEVTPFGVFDEVTTDAATGEVLLKGWAADWSAAKKSLQIQIFVDGQLVKTTLAGTNRDDVEKKTELGTAHGFLEKLMLQPGSHKIEVYAVNVNAAGKEVGSGNTLLGTQTITVAQVTK